jgi:hypothetical protein
MNDPQFTPQERALIEQLRSSPAPEMPPLAYERLHQQLMNEADFLFGDGPVSQPNLPPRRALRLWPLVAIFVLTMGLMIALALSSIPDDGPIEEALTTSTPTQTASPTSTLTPTITTTPSITPSPEPTQTLEVSLAAQLPVASPAGSGTPSEDDDDDRTEQAAPRMVIEGPVTTISANHIIIFGSLIEIDAVREAAAQLMTNQIARVEGDARFEDGRLIIRATSLTPIVPTISAPVAQPAAGQPAQQPAAPPPPPPPPAMDDDSNRDSVESRDS